MATGIAAVIYALVLYGLKHASRAYETAYHSIPQSMTHHSRRVLLRREDAIEMAIFYNALFWVLLTPASLLNPSHLAESQIGQFGLWGLRIWIWVGAALSVVPLAKALRYVITQRLAVTREIAELEREADEEEIIPDQSQMPET